MLYSPRPAVEMITSVVAPEAVLCRPMAVVMAFISFGTSSCVIIGQEVRCFGVVTKRATTCKGQTEKVWTGGRTSWRLRVVALSQACTHVCNPTSIVRMSGARAVKFVPHRPPSPNNHCRHHAREGTRGQPATSVKEAGAWWDVWAITSS